MLIGELSLNGESPLPQEMNDLPPARRRHIRRQPRVASSAEQYILLESLISLTSPTLNYFLLSFLSAIALGIAFFLNQPALLILGIVLAPFIVPIFGFALVPIHLKTMPGFKALSSLVFNVGLIFISGAIAGWAQKTGDIDQLGLFQFTELGWLNILILSISALLAAFAILRKGELPRVIGVLLSYEIVTPIALAGYALSLGIQSFWPGALLVSLTHLSLTVLLSLITYLVLGFSPKKGYGWLLALIPLILTALTLVFSAQNNQQLTGDPTLLPSPTAQLTASTATHSDVISQTPTTNTIPSRTVSPTVLSTRTQTPRPTPSITQSLTPSPTTFIGLVESAAGVVIRESPDFQAVVIDYANDGDVIEIISELIGENGIRWYQVNARDEQIGYILANLVDIPSVTQTRSP